MKLALAAIAVTNYCTIFRSVSRRAGENPCFISVQFIRFYNRSGSKKERNEEES